MNRFVSLAFAFLVLACIARPSPIVAQDTGQTGTIAGKVVDDRGAAPRHPVAPSSRPRDSIRRCPMQTLVVCLAALQQAAPPDGAREPWASKGHPLDVAKRHVEDIAAARRGSAADPKTPAFRSKPYALRDELPAAPGR